MLTANIDFVTDLLVETSGALNTPECAFIYLLNLEFSKQMHYITVNDCSFTLSSVQLC